MDKKYFDTITLFEAESTLNRMANYFLFLFLLNSYIFFHLGTIFWVVNISILIGTLLLKKFKKPIYALPLAVFAGIQVIIILHAYYGMSDKRNLMGRLYGGPSICLAVAALLIIEAAVKIYRLRNLEVSGRPNKSLKPMPPQQK